MRIFMLLLTFALMVAMGYFALTAYDAGATGYAAYYALLWLVNFASFTFWVGMDD